MDQLNTKSMIQSRTTWWALSALVAYLVKLFALPALPDDVNRELVAALQIALEAFVPVAILAAMWFRKKAEAVIDRWF